MLVLDVIVVVDLFSQVYLFYWFAYIVMNPLFQSITRNSIHVVLAIHSHRKITRCLPPATETNLYHSQVCNNKQQLKRNFQELRTIQVLYNYRLLHLRRI